MSIENQLTQKNSKLIFHKERIVSSNVSYGNRKAWLEFFLTGVKETTNQAADTAKLILSLFEQDREKIEQLGRTTAPTIRKTISHLSELGIV